jgi:hypothetical protein
MNDELHSITASGRPDIEHTRRALLNFLAQGTPADTSAPPPTSARASARGQPRCDAEAEKAPGLDWSSLVKAAMASWWHDHPARAGAHLLRSATEDYARRRPMQVVTIAAVAGAAVVLLKPWRLVSVTALMLSLVRSSNFTGMATSVLESAAQSMQKERT